MILALGPSQPHLSPDRGALSRLWPIGPMSQAHWAQWAQVLRPLGLGPDPIWH